MPIYEYQGQQYDIATDNPQEAKSKIFRHLGLEKPTKEKAFGKAAIESVPAGIGGLAGAEAGLAAGVGLGGLTGPAAPIAVPVLGLSGALIGGFGGGALAEKGAEYLGSKIPESVKAPLGFGTQQRKAEKEAYPGYTLAGELAGTLPFGTKAVTDYAKKGLKPTRELIVKAYGKEPTRLAETLRSRLTGNVQDVIRGAEKAQQQPISQLQRVGRAQEQLGARGPVATGRQAAREQQVEKSLAQLSPQGNVLAEDVGNIIQNAGRGNLQQLRAARQTGAIQEIKDPAFMDAKVREAKGDFIATNPNSAEILRSVLSRLERDISDTPEPYASELRRRFSSIRGTEKPLSEGERRAAELRASIMGGEPAVTKIEPMTLQQAEFLRRMLKDKNVAEVEGFKALDVERMGKLSDELTRAMTEYEPRVGEYLTKYREMSAPIERATAGRGFELTKADELAEEQVLFSADRAAAAKYYLDGSAERAQRLLELTGGKQPQLMNSVRGYLRSEMQGMSAKQTTDFIAKNDGLLRVFPELRSPMEQISKSKQIAETLGTRATQRAGEATTRLAGAEKKAVGQLSSAEKVAEQFRPQLNSLQLASPQETVKIGRQVIDSLRSSRQIDDATHRQLLQQVEQAETAAITKEQAKLQVQQAIRSALIAAGATYGVSLFGSKALTQGAE